MFLQYLVDKDKDVASLAICLNGMHKKVFSMNKRAKMINAKNYDKEGKQKRYEVEEKIYVFNILGLT